MPALSITLLILIRKTEIFKLILEKSRILENVCLFKYHSLTDICFSYLQDFNRHLDNLTEHYDIPKVSWTK